MRNDTHKPTRRAVPANTRRNIDEPTAHERLAHLDLVALVGQVIMWLGLAYLAFITVSALVMRVPGDIGLTVLGAVVAAVGAGIAIASTVSADNTRKRLQKMRRLNRHARSKARNRRSA